MTEHELFQKTFSTLHASPDTLMEVQKTMENSKKTHRNRTENSVHQMDRDGPDGIINPESIEGEDRQDDQTPADRADNRCTKRGCERAGRGDGDQSGQATVQSHPEIGFA